MTSTSTISKELQTRLALIMTNNSRSPPQTSSCNDKECDQAHAHPKSERKLHRCVSMCTTDSECYDVNNSNANVNLNECPKREVSTSDNVMHPVTSPSLKRPRSAPTSSPPREVSLSLETVHEESSYQSGTGTGKGTSMQIYDINLSSCSNDNVNSNTNSNIVNKATILSNIRKKQRKKESYHVRALNDSDPNIAYTPYIPIPSSPVRSVVSCDFDVSEYRICEEIMEDLSQEPNAQIQHDRVKEESQTNNDTTSRDELQMMDQEDKLQLSEIEHLSQDLQLHIKALRIEASLSPMKQLLHRIFTHQTWNRKGWFNKPVDAVALGLKDYTTVIKCPMDLGTIRNSLLTNVYHSHVEVARDIRLVFRNACLYNPPLHPVHEAAKPLLDYFEDAYAVILIKSAYAFPTQTQTQHQAQPSVEANKLQPQHFKLPLIKHTCKACLGRTCKMCNKGCLSLEPSLLICAGSSCSGSKIRRGIHYYCTKDGAKTWCQKCFPSLPALIPNDDSDAKSTDVLNKRDLLKRRNEEDVVERWIDCTKCGAGVHEMCAFVNKFCTDRDKFVCPLCTNSFFPEHAQDRTTEGANGDEDKFVYSFLSGKDEPERIKDSTSGTLFDSRGLPSCSTSHFIEKKIKERMLSLKCPTGAEDTLTVRLISDCQKEFNVPDVVLQHFRMARQSEANHSYGSMQGIDTFDEPQSSVEYRSKAIALFQRIDGVDVCIFCMYVQEYDVDVQQIKDVFSQQKRVYLAYIDSVEHFRPRILRTQVYHEILTAYFATARARGFENIHIWSCPPSRGNSFVFWGHPPSQRTPTKEHLLNWYHSALSHAVDRGVITDVKSLYEHSFERFDKSSKGKGVFSKNQSHRSTMICPPLLEGDFWIEEASRIQSSSISRWSKLKKPVESRNDEEKSKQFDPEQVFTGDHSRSPVMQVLKLLEDFIMDHPLALPFLRPVNAVALKLRDYHTIISKPMDLGTILTRCLMGEYQIFHDVTLDIELVFTNAMRYNPEGHIIHTMAKDLWNFTKDQLKRLVVYWGACGVKHMTCTDVEPDIAAFNNLSMRLSTIIIEPAQLLQSSADSGNANDACRNTFAEPIDRSKLLFDGADGIARLMVGRDTWLLDKRHKEMLKKKKKHGKNKDTALESQSSDSSKRVESWLSDEVLSTVRSLRSGIFVCYLTPTQNLTNLEKEKEKENDFLRYIEGFDLESVPAPSKPREQGIVPGLSETRHGFLEFSQYSNLQFDSVRRAKYSTAMLLYYLQSSESLGIIPRCFSCCDDIENVRFQKVNKAFDERRRSSQSFNIRMTCVDMTRTDLCEKCFDQLQNKKQQDFVPIRVSFRRS